MSVPKESAPDRTHGSLSRRDCRGLRPRVHEQQFPARRPACLPVAPVVQTEPRNRPQNAGGGRSAPPYGRERDRRCRRGPPPSRSTPSSAASWPDLSAQLARVTQRYEGRKTFDITLLATAADPACPPDFLGLPFRIAIPINVVELPEGQYTVTANGATTTFSVPVDLAGQPAASRGPRATPTRRGAGDTVAGRDDARGVHCRRVSRIIKVPIPTVPRPPSTWPTMRPCGNTWRTTALAGRAN